LLASLLTVKRNKRLLP